VTGYNEKIVSVDQAKVAPRCVQKRSFHYLGKGDLVGEKKKKGSSARENSKMNRPRTAFLREMERTLAGEGEF